MKFLLSVSQHLQALPRISWLAAVAVAFIINMVFGWIGLLIGVILGLVALPKAYRHLEHGHASSYTWLTAAFMLILGCGVILTTFHIPPVRRIVVELPKVWMLKYTKFPFE